MSHFVNFLCQIRKNCNHPAQTTLRKPEISWHFAMIRQTIPPFTMERVALRAGKQAPGQILSIGRIYCIWVGKGFNPPLSGAAAVRWPAA